MRADLDECVDAVLDRGFHGGLKAYRLAHVAPPVLRVELVCAGRLAGDRRVHRGLAGARRDAGEARAQFRCERIHLARMERVVDMQSASERSRRIGTEQLHQALDLIWRAAHSDQVGAVDRRDFQREPGLAEEAPRGFRSEPHRRHRAFPTRGLLQPAAMMDDRDGVGECEGARNIGSGHFADAVPDHRLGANAPGLPACRHSDLQRKCRGLGDAGAVDA